jgi:Protein of unknown function (DUF4435)
MGPRRRLPLGAGLDDILFSRGTVYVEGADDEKILRQAFGEKLIKFRIVEMRGRGHLEHEIKNIQGLDLAGKVSTTHYFIFDLDRRPTELSDTEHVKLLQWDRRCIENYLLDGIAIYDAILDEEVKSATKPEHRGALQALIKQLVAQQIAEVALATAYSKYNYESPGLRQKEVRNKPKNDAIVMLQSRLHEIQKQISNIDLQSWASDLAREADELRGQMEQDWEADWPKLCDGKRILEEIHAHYALRMPVSHFKRRIVRAMQARKSATLEAVTASIANLLRTGETA